MERRNKVRLQIWVDPELEAFVNEVHALYQRQGKRQTKTWIWERLVADGRRYWELQEKAANQLNGQLARLASEMEQTRATQEALAFSLCASPADFERFKAKVEEFKNGTHR